MLNKNSLKIEVEMLDEGFVIRELVSSIPNLTQSTILCPASKTPTQ